MTGHCEQGPTLLGRQPGPQGRGLAEGEEAPGGDPYELTRVADVMVRDVEVLEAGMRVAAAIEVLESGRRQAYPLLDAVTQSERTRRAYFVVRRRERPARIEASGPA